MMHKPWLSMAAVLLAVILSAGCTWPFAKPAPAGPAPEPAAAEAPAASPEKGPDSAALFPATDWELSFDIWDAGVAKAAHPVEQWLREGDRLVMAADGKPYATWLFDAAGVWRLDPKGGGALLRYLPPALKEGETWHQKSGDAEVWFALTKDQTECLVAEARSVDPKECWTLTVLNRGELTTFRFAPNLGPTLVKAVNYPQPSGSFVKEPKANKAGSLSAADRLTLLEKAPKPTAPKAAVTPATATEFAALRVKLPGIAIARADLDGDGQEETLRGPLKSWTMADIEILDKDGNLLTTSRTWRGQEQRVSLFSFRGVNHPFALIEDRGSGDAPSMSIARLAHSSNRWYLDRSYGWDIKSYGTAATRVATAEDGRVTVEWDMGDPARHTRVRQYRFDPVKFQAQRETESFRPEGKELVYPAEPLDVLQAAFFTRWFGLSDELPRYFAAADVAAAFQAQKAISQPNYRPGSVQFATVSDLKPMCGMKITPASPGWDGTAPFVATWGGYEWMARVWGKVTFGKDAQGRPVIKQLSIEGDCEGGM